MSRVSPELLAECIASVKSGRLTVDQCIEAHPAEAEELRRLLEVATSILPPQPARVDPAFRLKARVALVEAITAEKELATKPTRWRLWWSEAGRRDPARLTGRRVSVPALVIALVLLLTSAAGGGATYASQSALPGDTLYGVKTAVEEVQLRLAPGDEGKAEANIDCAGRRLAEAQTAVDTGRTGSAQAAIEAYSSCLAQAQQHLTQAASSGGDVTGLAMRLSEDLALHESTLEGVASRAPEPARAALDKAIQDTEKGLDTAIGLADSRASRAKKDSQQELSSSEPATGTATPTSTATGTPGTGERHGPLATEPPSGPLTIIPTQAISDVLNLKNDPAIPGDSYDGLLAKLKVAGEALERGNGRVALNELNAFLDQLNGMQRSGRISQTNYDALYADYSSLVTRLGGTPGSEAAPKSPTPASEPQDQRTQPKGRPDDGGNRTVITPTVSTGPRGRPDGRPSDPDGTTIPVTSPTHAASATAVPTPSPSSSDQDGSHGRPDGSGNGLPVATPVPAPTQARPVADPTQASPVATPGSDTDQSDKESGRQPPVPDPTAPPSPVPASPTPKAGSSQTDRESMVPVTQTPAPKRGSGD